MRTFTTYPGRDALLRHTRVGTQFNDIPGSKSIILWRKCGKTENPVKALLDVIKSCCVPSDKRFWSARIRQLTQRPAESIQEFTSRVMTPANTCNWANHNEQIVCGIIFRAAYRDALRKALLKDKSLTIKKFKEHLHDMKPHMLITKQL